MNLKLRKPLAFFDLETTGISITNDRIVEIAILKLHPNGEKESKCMRINPGRPIPIESSLIHGIYDEDVKDVPKFAQIAKSLAQFLEGTDLGGFNIVKFDVPMLVEELLRANVDFDLKNRNLIDAQKIFHLMEPRTLSAAYKFYCGKDLENAHSADADTQATYEVFEAQIARYENQVIIDKTTGKEIIPVKNDMSELHKLTLSNMVDLAGRIVYNKSNVPVINFGKYKDVPVADVLKKDLNYYDWIMKGDFPLDTKRKFTELKLQLLSNK